MSSLRLICLLLLALTLTPVWGQAVLRRTSLGTYYRVDPKFEPHLQATITRIRNQLRQERAKGKLIGFISIPLSSRGGGNYALNVEVSESIKGKLEQRYGKDHFWALAPGLVESSLPEVDGQHASGGDYMYMWTEILAGENGLGEDFDMVYFTGPSDFAAHMGLSGQNDLAQLERFMQQRAQTDSRFARSVSSPEEKAAFLRYYGLRASVTFSVGAHDEWNLFVKVNQNRRRSLGIAEQLPLYFDGRQLPPAAAETPISQGYELTL